MDLLYPPTCAACGQRGAWVCDLCRPWVTVLDRPWCARCGQPRTKVDDCQCSFYSPALDKVRSHAVYDDSWLRKAIVLAKYQYERPRLDLLGELLPPLVADIGEVDLLVPVPLHPRRYRERGFNQAAELAKIVSRLTGLQVVEGLTRVRNTPHQINLGALDREHNMRNAFSPASLTDLRKARVVLVDDVITTSATLGACAEALRQGGAQEVHAVTVARELFHSRLPSGEDV